jgi:hypothetical protein
MPLYDAALFFCRSILSLVFLLLFVAACVSAALLWVGSIFLLTSVNKGTPQQSE